MNFIDFEKAFDSIDHQVVWKILKHYGIPQKIISIIQQLYDEFSCQVIHDGNLTEPFTVTTGVRQACILSLLLLLMLIDWVIIKQLHSSLSSPITDGDRLGQQNSI